LLVVLFDDVLRLEGDDRAAAVELGVQVGVSKVDGVE
jgi:hypothetical protein